MTEIYWVVGGIGAAIVLLTSYMFIASRVHYALKMGLSTLTLGLSLLAWIITIGILGFPLDAMPPDNETLLSFVFDLKAKEIYLWTVEHNVPRAYMIPYTDEIAKKLIEAQEKALASHGRMVWRMGNGSGKKNGHGNSDSGGHDQADGNGSGIPADSNQNVSIDVVPSIPEKDS